MKKLSVLATLSFALLTSSQSALTQTPSIQDFDQLVDIAEALFPSDFSPPAATQTVAAEGSTFFARDYCYLAPCVGSGVAIAANVTGGAGFIQGGVYIIGGSFGQAVQYLGTLDDLVTQALALQGDGDGGDNGGDNGDGGTGGNTGESRIISLGSGACGNFVFPAAGTQTRSRITAQELDDDGQPTGGTFTFEQTMLWIESSNLQTTTRTEWAISAGGGQTTTIIESTDRYQIMNNARYLTDSDSTTDTTISIPGFQQQQLSSSETVYESPGLLVGPADTVCDNGEWYVAETTSTITNEFQTPLPGVPSEQTFVSDSAPATTVVDGVNLSVTVEAGTFNTIKIITTNEDGESIIWFDMATGVTVKSEIYDPDGTLVGGSELLEISS